MCIELKNEPQKHSTVFKVDFLFICMNYLGFKVSRQVLEAIVRRYGGKACQLSFEDFIHSCCKLVNLFSKCCHLGFIFCL